MKVDDIKEEALRLNPKARADLARDLLASLDAMSDVEIEKLWVDEAIRRDEEVDSGAARAYPAEEVFSRARARRN